MLPLEFVQEVFQIGGGGSGGLAVLVDRLLELLAQDADVIRSSDTELDAVGRGLDNLHLDVLADEQRFPGPSGKYKHSAYPLSADERISHRPVPLEDDLTGDPAGGVDHDRAFEVDRGILEGILEHDQQPAHTVLLADLLFERGGQLGEVVGHHRVGVGQDEAELRLLKRLQKCKVAADRIVIQKNKPALVLKPKNRADKSNFAGILDFDDPEIPGTNFHLIILRCD